MAPCGGSVAHNYKKKFKVPKSCLLIELFEFSALATKPSFILPNPAKIMKKSLNEIS